MLGLHRFSFGKGRNILLSSLLLVGHHFLIVVPVCLVLESLQLVVLGKTLIVALPFLEFPLLFQLLLLLFLFDELVELLLVEVLIGTTWVDCR
jgi:hypothetical protein